MIQQTAGCLFICDLYSLPQTGEVFWIKPPADEYSTETITTLMQVLFNIFIFLQSFGLIKAAVKKQTLLQYNLRTYLFLFIAYNGLVFKLTIVSFGETAIRHGVVSAAVSLACKDQKST